MNTLTPYKIGLIGCAGLGKSTIAGKISKELCLPFLNSKGITRPILEKEGWEYSNNHFVERVLACKPIEFSLVMKRLEEESLLTGGFVTDRTTLECFCYAFLATHTYTKEDFSMLENTCRKNMKNYSHLFYIPLENAWLEENGVRTVDWNFQRMVDILIRGILRDWELDYTMVPPDVIKKSKTAEFILSSIQEKEEGK